MAQFSVKVSRPTDEKLDLVRTYLKRKAQPSDSLIIESPIRDNLIDQFQADFTRCRIDPNMSTEAIDRKISEISETLLEIDNFKRELEWLRCEVSANEIYKTHLPQRNSSNSRAQQKIN